jgi:spermidine/putrescine transport system ATP-binding protein
VQDKSPPSGIDDYHLIELVDVTKVFDTTVALSRMNLYVRRREFVTLLGPSGCGKSTTLRIIGGFEQPTDGKVLFEGEDITRLPPYKRRVNTVFQRYALFPHLNVFDNIAFGLTIAKVHRPEITRRVGAMLDLVGLRGMERRSVDALSGGQQQRVAIARALVNEPEVLLLDEPLGALDLRLRKDMQLELKKMQQRLGITFLYVTHDQEEALTMSDTIVVMREGRIQQIGTPKRIYDEPKNAFVAAFIGESNILDAVMIRDERVRFCEREFICVDRGFGQNKRVDVVLRPEDLTLVPAEQGMLSGVVMSVLFKGVHYEMMIDCGCGALKVHSTSMAPEGERVGLSVVPFNIHIMEKVGEACPA